jgi:hypothetical protein
MPEITVAEDFYSAIEESARLIGAPCSRDQVWPILTAFEGALPEAGLVVSLSTGEHAQGEFDYTITVPIAFGDPYAAARSSGLVPETDHPSASLLAEVQARAAVSEHLIDAGVSSGFSKIYASFPFDRQPVPKLAEIGSMPPAVAQNVDLFARHHLNDVAMIGIDYRHKTVNLYFAQLPDEYREARNILSLHREIGLPEPGGKWLEFAQKSFRVYVTLSWDSPEIKRICFAHPPVRNWTPKAYPVPIEPKIENFIKNSRRFYDGQTVVIAAVKWTPEGEYLNLGPYCRFSPLMRNMIEKMIGEKL